MNIYRLNIMVEEKDYNLALGFLCNEVPFGWEEQSLFCGETLFCIHSDNQDFLKKIQTGIKEIDKNCKTELTEVENVDWQNAWKEFFTPVSCGSRFVVSPPWLLNEDFGERQKIIIEPKSAFGTGHHATTVLCLTALDNLLTENKVRKGQRFLDLGCGSGILGIAAAKNGLFGMGIDIDELAVENSKGNLILNQVDSVNIFNGSIELAQGEFDLIMANILSRPLISLAPQICAKLKPGGCLILSGILDIQAEDVEKAYMACGLKKAARLEDGEWQALIWG